MASNDPQLPQAFYPLPPKVLWPGDSLKVTCDFDSSSRSTPTPVGATHKDEMCNLYMMVYAPHPVIVMCSGNRFTANSRSPGAMPSASIFVPDPCPFWKPAEPKDPSNALGDVTSVAMGPDYSMWALYRCGSTWRPGARHAACLLL